jgi:hypothetical protein
MLELVASMPENGWAFVREDGRLVAVRPPYRSSNRVEVDESTVEAAVQKHGFAAPATPVRLDQWSDVISYISDEVARCRPELDNGSDPAGEGLLEFEPLSVIKEFLDRVETELLPNRKYRHAESLAKAITELQSVRADPDLLTRAVRLGCRATVMMGERGNSFSLEAPDAPALFESVYERYGRDVVEHYADSIANAHQMMAVAS